MAIHPLAILHEDADLAPDAEVGPFCVLGSDGAGAPLRVGPRALLRSHVVIYRDSSVGADFRAGHHVLVREATHVGASVSIGSGTIVEHHVDIGDGVRVHSRCFVPEFSRLEAGAWLGPGVVLTNARYPNRPDTKDRLEGVLVEEDAVIGAGAIILPGVVIGRSALVGAGAVVVRDVPPGATVVGNPGRLLA